MYLVNNFGSLCNPTNLPFKNTFVNKTLSFKVIFLSSINSPSTSER